MSLSLCIRLAYSHDNGIVIIDVIQKCVVINASTCELHGPINPPHISQRDIIQSSGGKASNSGQILGKSPKRMSGTTSATIQTTDTSNVNSSSQDNHTQIDLFGQQQQRKSPPFDQVSVITL